MERQHRLALARGLTEADTSVAVGFRRGILDPGDIAQVDNLAVLAKHGCPGHFLDAGECRTGVQSHAAVGLFEATGLEVDVSGL